MIEHDYVDNPNHELPDWLLKSFDDARAARLEALARSHRFLAESRPSGEEAAIFHAAEHEGFKGDDGRARSALQAYADRVGKLGWTDFQPELAPLDAAPFAAGADFWWARTQWYGGGGIAVSSQTDGLHFFGHRDYNGDPLLPFSTGAWATFELQPERRPPSASGRYNSAPWVELFGNITGWTNIQSCPWACDDKWCKCWMYLRQSAIQFVDDVGTWRLCGEATARRTWIDEDGNGRTVVAQMPGYLPMPFLQFGLIRPDRSIFVDLEVRFDIQLEGSSYIGFSPADNPANSVLLRHFQWPCYAA
ncbi:hypothetical protein GCM10011390_48500 [Aureimonas endophytica]|uniref:Uncharacterized protein n=1 Tax=Aureimonas endophytica TaxID=2027858 RepID=A0A917ECY7_9HYPH|nr:hypothetical protein [Aureimonas endophytica]GGE23371.1 hypothetical protein GCM10011390_48500 [Aureimonas endophytica]